ncbi:cytohesin-3-like isoform X2 [Labrus mixtus]|uniref:cytohesin-3-like isoform X2 n=1 Tax=Labrus mixtus TaxID=508554 RepID=UPI0029C05E0D|nr:cytohesin-3-like isoform X2 [Labrus mixtus]
MNIRRKDSFLWGRAPPKPPPGESSVHTNRCGLPDDSQMNHNMPEILQPHLKEQKRFLRGKKKFNMDPKKGVQYLIENGLLEWRAEPFAEFLYKEEGLNKTAIGNFLGEREEMHLEILKSFVGLHEFSDLNLVQALRQFLWSFRLPGEAQKIDRMMEAFAARYCECNPGVFISTDTCYILSFSIIMLNTSLHNPNVKEKPSLQRFVSMNRAINSGEDLPTELLTKLYSSIRSEPFKIPEDDGNDLTLTFFNPDREGWLLKNGEKKSKKKHTRQEFSADQPEPVSPLKSLTFCVEGGRVKTWKRRWFILTDSCLYYFQYTTDKDPIGIIPLENLSVRKLQDTSKPYCLELYNPKGLKIKACKTENRGRVVQGKHQSYKLSAASEEERDVWMDAIRSSITKDPFYDLVALRKRKLINNSPSKD